MNISRIFLFASLFLFLGTAIVNGQENTALTNVDPDELLGTANGEITLDDLTIASKITKAKPSNTDNTSRESCSGDAGDITTTFTNGNGASGNMFNVTNVSGFPIEIQSFAGNIEPFAPKPATVKLWYREGGYEGFETNSAAWILFGEDNAVQTQGQNTPTPINIGGLILKPGVKYGFFLYDTNSNTDYTNGSNTYDNGDLLIETGLGRGLNNSNPFNGGVFNPRTWNGTIYYCKGGDVPGPWQSAVVGDVGDCNTSSELGSEFYVSSCNNNAFPGTTSDNLNYVYQTLCGDGEVAVKIESVTDNGYGGVMIRESLNANAKQVSMFSDLSNLIRWESRAVTGMPKSIQSFYKPNPFWLKLVRQGDWIFGYYSATGYNYQIVQAAYVPMNACVEYGIATFSFNVGETATAIFSNASVVDGEGLLQAPDTEEQSIGYQRANIFPNPASHDITVEITPNDVRSTTLVLRNSFGQMIEQRQLEPGTFRTQWDVVHLSNGVYFVEIVRTGEQTQVLRFVKSN